MDLLRQIEKQINKQSQITNENNSNKPLLNDAVVLSHSDQSLIRNLYFELYLINITFYT